MGLLVLWGGGGSINQQATVDWVSSSKIDSLLTVGWHIVYLDEEAESLILSLPILEQLLGFRLVGGKHGASVTQTITSVGLKLCACVCVCVCVWGGVGGTQSPQQRKG